MPKWIGPFEVEKAVGLVAYQLNLPRNMQVHKVFHVSLLKPYRSDGSLQPPPLPVELEDGSEWSLVKQVCVHRESTTGKNGKQERRSCLDKWRVYGDEHNRSLSAISLLLACRNLGAAKHCRNPRLGKVLRLHLERRHSAMPDQQH